MMVVPYSPRVAPDAGSSSLPGSEWERISVLLIEDDEADAVLVQELIADATPGLQLRWADSVNAARNQIATERPDCVLLDLHLPDAQGIDALTRIRQSAPTVPVVVLTGLSDEHFGVSAVASGAQDYLIKGRVEPDAFRRAVRYAIERQRAEVTAAELRVSQVRAEENARLERGLLPSPLLHDDPGVDIVTRYRPGRANALLGGDFYDVVQTEDGAVHVLIGDVSGHGPDEAALGVALRIAWRTLVLAGIHGAAKLRELERILRLERSTDSIFATMLVVIMRPGTNRITVLRAGHPGMLLHGPDTVEWVEPMGGPALGVVPNMEQWPEHEMYLPPRHGLILLTDGLFEGHSGQGNERLGEAGLLQLARSIPPCTPESFVDSLIDGAEQLAYSHGGLADDVAVLRVQRSEKETGA